MATSRLDQRRAQFQQYKQDVRERGKPFYPYAMFHDTVMSLVVVSVIIGLAVIWKYTIPDGSDGTDPGTLGPLYTEEADPGTTNFIPRPDWFFYFLFYLLRIFKWPESVILGTVGIPTILILLLITLPFLDRRTERRLVRRPVAMVAFVLTVISMGVLTYEGATAKESLGGVEPEVLASWQERNNLPEDALEGANIFGVVGCQQCHVYLGVGSANVGAPELTDIGAQEGKDAEFFARYVANPSAFGNDVMPRYEGLGDENLQAIGRFLEASKGPQE
jgi:quinol---cytochrome c reductase cytochrome c subunit, bacillus type